MRLFSVNEEKITARYGKDILKTESVVDILSPYSRDNKIKTFFNLNVLDGILTSATTFLVGDQERTIFEKRDREIYDLLLMTGNVATIRKEVLSLNHSDKLKLIRYTKEDLKSLLLLEVDEEIINFKPEEWVETELTCFSALFNEKELITHNSEYIPRFLNLDIVSSLINLLAIENISADELEKALEISERYRDDHYGCNMNSTFLPKEVFEGHDLFKDLELSHHNFNVIERFFSESDGEMIFSGQNNILGNYYKSVIDKIEIVKRDYQF